jgi:hypothetical protein
MLLLFWKNKHYDNISKMQHTHRPIHYGYQSLVVSKWQVHRIKRISMNIAMNDVEIMECFQQVNKSCEDEMASLTVRSMSQWLRVMQWHHLVLISGRLEHTNKVFQFVHGLLCRVVGIL